ncbi:MAG: transcription termination/antitermination protein NusG [Bacteroidaceae bacterium]|nr:transcription termination/antitermination protein NusG [Bacteroidaceae bacterium]
MAETGKQWYVMRAISGKESKVKEYIDAMLHQGGEFAKHVAQVLIPTEKIVSVRNGKRVVKEKNRFAGYVFVEAELVGEIQPRLRAVPNVLGFLSDTKTNTTPMPLRAHEVNQMLGTVDELQEIPEDVVIPFEIGENVKVVDGPFTGFDAVIEDINSEKKKLKVSVKIFGRKTPLELGFMQIEKQ